MNKKVTTFALECSVHFLGEQRTELYRWYCSGVAQVKNVLGAKNGLQGQTCLPAGRLVLCWKVVVRRL